MESMKLLSRVTSALVASPIALVATLRMISLDLLALACFRISFWLSAEILTSATLDLVPSALTFSVTLTSVGAVVVPVLVSVVTSLTSSMTSPPGVFLLSEPYSLV